MGWLPILFALGVAAVAPLVLVLLRRSKVAPADRAAYDIAVYRDHLAEIERDLARGLMTDAEAQTVRLETQRRILAVASGAPDACALPPSVPRAVAAGVALLVPAAAMALYLQIGSPELPDRPYAGVQASRLNIADAQAERVLAMVDKLAARVEADPNDLSGWLSLGRSYLVLGRAADSAAAYRRAVGLGARDSETLSAFGEVLVKEAGGSVTGEARETFVQVLRLNRDDPRAHHYLALERLQVGDARRAIAIWRDLLNDSPADAPWIPGVREQMDAAAAKAGINPALIEPVHPLFGISR